jgi:quinol monooxygenase YgiN
MFFVTTRFSARSEKNQDAMRLARAFQGCQQPGNVSSVLYIEADNPNIFFLLEEWGTSESYQQFYQQHLENLFAGTQEVFLAAPDIGQVDVMPRVASFSQPTAGVATEIAPQMQPLSFAQTVPAVTAEVAPKIEYKPNSRVKKESTYLLDYAKIVTSQNGEDGILEQIFKIMGSSCKHCVELGAFDGKTLSNTWNLINRENWSATLIEGRELLYGLLAGRYSSGNPDPVEAASAARVKTIHAFVTFSGSNSLDALLAERGVPRDFDFLSIDIDSNDWYLWESLKEYKPRLVMIEFNATIPNDVYYVQGCDPNINQGCSLLALIELGKSKGYELIAVTVNNAFFVPKELFGLFAIADNQIDSMYFNSDLQTKLFQGYDGELIICGCQRLHWHDLAFSQEDIQVLPKPLRKYGIQFFDSQAVVRQEMAHSSMVKP